jgi:outer membrane protein TolC
LAKAQESFQIATTTYRRGATSLLEVQEAQRTLNQTQVVANQAHFDYRLSLAHLAQALGAPWRRPRQVRRASPRTRTVAHVPHGLDERCGGEA